MVPSLLNAGRSLPSDSTVVSPRMPSSALTTTGSPLRCGISTGTTSSSKTPFFHASAARWCERAENASCSSRVRLAPAALHCSVRPPIGLVGELVVERVVGHRVDQRGVAVLEALAGLRQQVRRLGHRLHAAGDDDLVLAGADQLVGHRDRVDAREADLVDRDRRDVHRDAAVDRRLAGGVLPGAGADDLAHDHVVDLVAGDAGLLERALDGDATEVGRREVLEAAEQAADRGAGPGDDDGSGHMGLPPAAARTCGCARDDTQPRAAGGRGGDGCRGVEHVTGGRAPASRRTTMAAMSSHLRRTCPSTSSPPSTTSASPCPTSTRRSRSTATPSACTLVHEETNEEQGVREAMVAVGDSGSCIQLLAPLTPESTIAKFLDRSGPGCSSWPTGWPTSRRSARSCASAACACCTTSRARHLGLPDQLRPPQGRRRRPGRARRARRRPLT